MYLPPSNCSDECVTTLPVPNYSEGQFLFLSHESTAFRSCAMRRFAKQQPKRKELQPAAILASTAISEIRSAFYFFRFHFMQSSSSVSLIFFFALVHFISDVQKHERSAGNSPVVSEMMEKRSCQRTAASFAVFQTLRGVVSYR